jgi:hypothetical protein
MVEPTEGSSWTNVSTRFFRLLSGGVYFYAVTVVVALTGFTPSMVLLFGNQKH